MNSININKKNMLRFTSSALFKVFRLLLLIGVSYVVLYPVLKMLSVSFTTPDEMTAGGGRWLPLEPTFVNYINSQNYFNYFKHAGVTLAIAGVSTVIQLVICSLVGYGLARYKFKGNALVYGAVIFTIVMPIQTAQIPLYLYYRWFDFFGIGKLIGLITGTPLTVNLLDGYWSYYVPALFGVGLKSGLFIFLFRQFFAGMPRDLEDAGKVDGCNPLMIYLKIMVPNIKPVFVTVALLSMIYYWNDSLIAGMANLTENPPLMLAVERLVTMRAGYSQELEVTRMEVEYHAILITAVAPLMIVFIACQRFFVECMDRSGIKG